MTLDDLKRLFARQTLFRLDTVLAIKLVPIVYAAGLFALLLWTVRHLFASFSMGFGDGLWGLLEIVGFGLLMLLILRIACEALLIYFKRNEDVGNLLTRSRYSASLLDEVRDAIHDLAEADGPHYGEVDDGIMPATEPGPTSTIGPATRPGESVTSADRA